MQEDQWVIADLRGKAPTCGGAIRSGRSAMKKKDQPNAMVRNESTSQLLGNLRELIQAARQKA
jgi:hypothetical protein